MNFYVETTASIVAKLGSKLRNQIEIGKRAKGKKNYATREEMKSEEYARENKRIETQKLNRREIDFGVDGIHLALALHQKRTAI